MHRGGTSRIANPNDFFGLPKIFGLTLSDGARATCFAGVAKSSQPLKTDSAYAIVLSSG